MRNKKIRVLSILFLTLLLLGFGGLSLAASTQDSDQSMVEAIHELHDHVFAHLHDLHHHLMDHFHSSDHDQEIRELESQGGTEPQLNEEVDESEVDHEGESGEISH